MKLNSPLFDKIRVKPDKDRRVRKEQQHPPCEWPGCDNPGTHRAPKGRGRENEYLRYCLDHVREYNHSYNFFKDMPADAVASYQKDAQTGHRPTWKMGSMGGDRSKRAAPGELPEGTEDRFGLFRRSGRARPAPNKSARPVHNAARKAFEELSLEVTATKEEIKARFKDLVKKHHPDVNGGDQSSEDKLRDIIVAYNYLKSVGFC